MLERKGKLTKEHIIHKILKTAVLFMDTNMVKYKILSRKESYQLQEGGLV